MITAIAGVSAYYLGGVVSYANQAKIELLGVPAGLIETHGAVSPEVAAAMAEGVRNRLGADLGVSTTGVAGPGGGTPEKPVGLVYLGLATAKGTDTHRLDIGSDQPRDSHPAARGQSRTELGQAEAARRAVSRSTGLNGRASLRASRMWEGEASSEPALARICLIAALATKAR